MLSSWDALQLVIAWFGGHGHLQEGKLLLQGAQECGGHIREDLRQGGGHAAVEAQKMRRPLRRIKQRPRLHMHRNRLTTP